MALIAWNTGRQDDWESEESYLAEQMRCIPDPDCDEDMTSDRADQRQVDNDALREEVDLVTAIEWPLFALGVIGVGVATYLFFGGPRSGRYSQVSLAPRPNGFALVF